MSQINNTPVIIGIGKVRFDIDRSAIILNRLLVITEAVIGKPSVIIGICITRVDVDSPAIILNRLL